MVPVMHGRPRFPRIVVTPDADEMLALLAQHSFAEPSAVVSRLQVPRGWKHLKAFRVQLFLKTHFALAGTAAARARSKTKHDIADVFVGGMASANYRFD